MMENESHDEIEQRFKQLREMTEHLPAFPETIAQQSGFKEHKMHSGTSYSWDLLTRPEVGVADWFNSKGTVFPFHSHTAREWIIVTEGSIILQIGDKEAKRFVAGTYVCIEPNVRHAARFIEDCKYLAIVIPSVTDWPKADGASEV